METVRTKEKAIEFLCLWLADQAPEKAITGIEESKCGETLLLKAGWYGGDKHKTIPYCEN